MAIRAFLTTWSLVDGEIHNPIADHVGQQPDQGIILSMFYPDADVNGLPDKPVLMVLVESQQLNGRAIEALGNLEGVTLIPGARPDKGIPSLPPSVRGDIDGLVAAHKIPQSVVTGAATMGDLLGGLARYINPGNTGIAHYLATRPAEFG